MLDELDRAYRETDYWVDGPVGRFAIRIDEPCPSLDELLAGDGASCWAFITACNPNSQRLSDEVNAIRMSHLVADVRIAGQRFYSGEGIGRDGRWPPEPSLLILDIEEASAIELAKRYGQLAIVCGRVGAVPHLHWTGLGEPAA